MRFTTFFILLLLCLTGCREESEIVTTTVVGTIPPSTTVSASITSVVTDQDGALLSDANIVGLGSTTRNNPDGSVTINANTLSSDGNFVTITAPGKWPEYRLLMLNNNGELVETFVLEDKVKAGSILSTTGGAIELGEDFEFGISLLPNTVATDEDGNVYTGPIDFYINHDAPDDPIEMLNSAGNVQAMTSEGNTAILESYGMMDISMETPDGGLLVLDASTPAAVRIPLNTSSGPNAPVEIDAWMLDIDGGLWLPSGAAIRGANYYVSSITSSGSYNCAISWPVARFSAQLTSNGVPITHTAFSIVIDFGYSCWNATSDSKGELSAWVAANTGMKLFVTDACGGDVVPITISRLNEGSLFPAGNVSPELSSKSFLASVADCSGTRLPDLNQNEIWINGYGSEGGYVSTQPDGKAFVSGIGCDTDDLLIQAFTRDYKAASRLIRRSSDDLNSQPLEVCSDLESGENFSLSIDGNDLTITELAPIYWPGNGNYNWLIRAGVEFAGEEYSLLLSLKDPSTGTYAADDAKMAIYRLAPGQEFGEGKVYVDPASTLELKGTAYDATEGVFEATFSATMSLQNDVNQSVEAVNLPISGAFRIKL